MRYFTQPNYPQRCKTIYNGAARDFNVSLNRPSSFKQATPDVDLLLADDAAWAAPTKGYYAVMASRY